MLQDFYKPHPKVLTNKAIFLDRDGVLNEDHVDYAWNKTNFTILPGVPEALISLKAAGYLIIIITNQSGIAKKVYTESDVLWCLEKIQKASGYAIEDHYMAPHHPDYTTRSLSRKPDSLLFEKAIAKHKVDVQNSYMLGDKGRDLEPAKRVGFKNLITIGLPDQGKDIRTGYADSLKNAVDQIILA